MASPASLRVASTPSPNRVIRMSRARVRPPGPTTSSRVEFVPQSRAATGPGAFGVTALL